MTAPPGLLAAVGQLSGHVVCVERCGAVELAYDAERGCPAICHPYADCPDYLLPDSPAALALAEYVFDLLAALVVMADYGEPLPVNVWEVAP